MDCLAGYFLPFDNLKALGLRLGNKTYKDDVEGPDCYENLMTEAMTAGGSEFTYGQLIRRLHPFTYQDVFGVVFARTVGRCTKLSEMYEQPGDKIAKALLDRVG
jgi:hypothetical protein